MNNQKEGLEGIPFFIDAEWESQPSAAKMV
jgi:hypothetical protein